MSDQAIVLRAVAEDEWPAFVRTTHTAFGSLPRDDDLRSDRRAWSLDRSIGAFADGQVVGTAGAFSFDLTLPGLTSAPAAGITWVSVLPTARRRGVLSRMMRHQLDDVHAREEPVAVLLASESSIYGRFGYGLATTQAEYEIRREHRHLAEPHTPGGRVVLVDERAAEERLPAVYEEVRRRQPGEVSRPDAWWRNFFRDGKPSGNAGARFYALYEGPRGEPDGYAYYRIGNRTGGADTAAAMVQGLGAVTLDAYLSLWQYLTDLDLTDRTTTTTRPLEELLRHRLADPRRLSVVGLHDGLWCRIVDVAAALAARRYLVDDRLVLEVVDDGCPWNTGRWELTGGPDGAECRPSRREPDLTMRAADLGAVFLGGTRLSLLVQAGRVEASAPGVARRGDAFFQSDVAPYCSTSF